MTNARNLGKYRIVAELGHGGMAEVFLSMVAGPLGSGFTKLAVIKKLRPHLTEDLEFIAMLVDEARISARLNHPNVVQTLEVGVENGEYFLAMEFLDGQPLHRIQRRAQRAGTPLAAELQYVVIADTLAGLQHAHELADYDGSPLGIVHRDVTPQNIFVTYDGQVKVVDFGIAKAAGRASETRQGIVKGKVRYMSPEQAMGLAVDCRSDVFAAGVLLWEAATKTHFWRDLDELAIVQSLIAGEFDPSPRSLVPEVSPAIDAICRRAMARDARDRYGSAAELRADLESFIADDIVAARRKLGPLVAELFTKERRRLRDVIEQTSRANVEPMSLATLAASHSIQLALMDSLSGPLSGVSGLTPSDASQVPSLSPVVMMGSLPPPSAGDGARPANHRFRLAASVATLVVAASMLVAFVLLRLSGVAPGTFASSSPSARERAQVVVARTPITVRSTPSRKVAASLQAPVETSPAPAHEARAARARPDQARPAAPPAPIATAEAGEAPSAAPAPTPNDMNVREGSKRKPALDLADPWNGAR